MKTIVKSDGWKAFWVILSLFLVPPLTSNCQTESQLAENVDALIQLDGRQKVVLEIEAGEISLISSESANEVRVQGQIRHGTAMQFSYELLPSTLLIRLHSERRPFGGYRSSPASLMVFLPAGLAVTVNSFEANTTVENFSGQLLINTIAGDLSARHVRGEITLISARGDIALQDASGRVRVLGEHGELDLENVDGIIGASTIMGRIRYVGRPLPGDEIRFEVDHGSVEIILAPDADLDVLIRSTSGEITCLTPRLQRSARECRGMLGAGGAKLTVRTVSGNVTLHLGSFLP